MLDSNATMYTHLSKASSIRRARISNSLRYKKEERPHAYAMDMIRG